MKRAVMVLGLLCSVMISSGCQSNRACNNCNGPLGCRPCRIGWQRGGTDYQRFMSNTEFRGNSGPGAAQVAYPYYTTRGPRDFLVNNPPTIGN